MGSLYGTSIHPFSTLGACQILNHIGGFGNEIRAPSEVEMKVRFILVWVFLEGASGDEVGRR